jgi:hypothetical protein
MGHSQDLLKAGFCLTSLLHGTPHEQLPLQPIELGLIELLPFVFPRKQGQSDVTVHTVRHPLPASLSVKKDA